MRAKFITFEGGEGSGKSTQSKKLHEYLTSQNIKAIWTREVGGTPVAEKIRDVLVYNDLYPFSELMLVMAARYEHINKIIIPALNDNCWVICDRFVDSTVAYQSCDDDLTFAKIYDLHNSFMKDVNTKKALIPDITFFMDSPPSVALRRSISTMNVNKFEEKDLKFHNMVYENFQKISGLFADRVKRIKVASKDISEIHQEILEMISIF